MISRGYYDYHVTVSLVSGLVLCSRLRKVIDESYDKSPSQIRFRNWMGDNSLKCLDQLAGSGCGRYVVNSKK